MTTKTMAGTPSTHPSRYLPTEILLDRRRAGKRLVAAELFHFNPLEAIGGRLKWM
jgi:hypothetical protein